jgi:uncharacterized protein (TIGR02246 family)
MIAARSARERARDVVAALVDAYNRKDLERTATLYADEVRLWTPSRGHERGKDRVVARCRRLFEQRPDERLVADTVVTNGTTTVVELTSRGTDSSGRPHTIVFTAVIELDGDRIAEMRTYVDPQS